MEKMLTVAAIILSIGLIGFALIQTNTGSSLFTSNNNTMLATVASADFASKNNDEERTIIDVRTPGEYASGHISGSVNTDFYSSDFANELDKLDKSAKYSIYCRSGNRSGQALHIMESLGFTDVIDLDGGIIAWTGAGNTLCTDC